ncbi:response regulator [Nocardia heshunensis]
MSAQAARRVLLVDDHPLFRDGLADAIGTDASFIVVAHAATVKEALAQAQRVQPDVVVMDLGLPDGSGIEATRALLTIYPQLRILVMTMSDDGDNLLATLRAGAHGYILKGAQREETLRALHTVAEGGAIFSAEMAEQIKNLFTRSGALPARAAFPTLTQREREILELIAQGLTYRHIAQRLCVTEKTVRNHTGSIFAKLQVHDRAEAILRAREAGLGDPDGGRAGLSTDCAR